MVVQRRYSPEQRTTIYDVAQRVGVSPSTVSRAFSRPGRVSSETAARIYATAEEMGYRSAEIFQPIVPVRSSVIGLAVSDITNPFYFGIVRGAEQAAAEAGFTLVVGDAHESDRKEREMLGRQLPLVEGLVITSSRLSDTDLRALARTVPVVVLNRDVRGLPSVVPDNPRGIRRAVEHLGSLGHQSVAYVAGPPASWPDGMRWRAMREAAMELDLTVHRIGPVPPTARGGTVAAREVADRGYAAVITYNDMIGIGLIKELATQGLEVPGDVSVVGFDDNFVADLVAPGLTTVSSPTLLLGQIAVQTLLAVRGGAKHHQEWATVLPVHLVVRESTGPVRTGPGRGSRQHCG